MWRRLLLISLVTTLAFSFAFAEVGQAIGEDDSQIGRIKAKLENNETLTPAEKDLAWDNGLFEEQIAPPAYYNPSDLRTAYLEEGFETWPPAGWTLDPATGTGAWLQDAGDDHGPGSVVEGTSAAFFNEYDYSTGTTGTMTTPAIDLTSATAPRLSFYYWDGSGTDVVDVLVSTDNTTFTSVYTTPSTVSSWTEILVDLTSYVGNATVYVQFSGYSYYGLNNPHIDAFSVDEAPTGPVIALSTSAIDFGSTIPGMSVDAVLTISNNGGGPLQISSILPSSYPPFGVGSYSSPLAAGASMDVTMTFAPDVAGDFTGDITITSNDPASPHVITVAGSGAPTSGGPGAAGYSWVSSFDAAGPTFAWIDSTGSTSSNIANGDDYRGTIALPFPVRFDGAIYTEITGTTNGWIGMGPSSDYSSSYYSNVTMPVSSAPNKVIAPFWDDLKAGGSYHGTMVHKTVGTEPNRQFVVIWQDVYRTGAATDDWYTFEVIFDEATSDIYFQYLDVSIGNASYDNGKSATIGVENSDGSDAILIGFNGAPQGVYANEVIHFIAPPAPTVPNMVLDVSELNFGTLAAGSSASADVTITNSGSGDLVITGVTVAAPFSSTFSGTIPAAGSAVATVAFDPAVAGDYSETLTFTVSGGFTGSNELAVMGGAYPDNFVMEGFEGSFPPFGWTIIDVDGGSAFNPDLSYIDPHTGSVAAEGMGCADDYLVTPLMAIPAGYATMSFWVGQESVNYQNSFEIMVSTTGMATTDFVQVADFPMYTRGATDWTAESVDLSAYAGQEVYVAIHVYYSESAYYGFGFDDFILPPLVPSANTLFFSEYIEGSSNNKAIEIYNGTGVEVDLSDYVILRYNNGATTGADSTSLTGMLANDDVYVIANSSAMAEILNVADETGTVTYYNGDDFLGLVYDANGDDVFDIATEVVDVIGVLGEDPGTNWPVAGGLGATSEFTLMRKASVVTGNTDWAASAGTNADDSEWLVYEQNYWYGLGYFPDYPMPGEICDLALSYGAVNDPAVMGDLMAGGHDWYSFTTDGSYQQVTASLCGGSGLGDSKLAVFAACEDFEGWPAFGAPVGAIGYNDDACGLLSEVSLDGLEAGTYYVVVYGYSATQAGAYELAVTGVMDPCEAFTDIYEPNNDMESATVAMDGDAFDAALCPTTDSDWYAISGLALGTITVETAPLSVGEYDTDTYFYFYGPDGELIDTDDDGGVGYTSMISHELLADGIYYLEVVVSSWAAGDVFDYTLHVTVEDPPLPIPQNLMATAGFGFVDLSWDPVPTLELVGRTNMGISALKTSNSKDNLHPDKAMLNQILTRKQNEQNALMAGDALRDPGDTCAEAIDYGAVNGVAITGDLPAADHDWYSFTTDGTFQQITVSLCGSADLTTPIGDSKLAVFASCEDFVEWPGFGAPVGAIAYNDDGCGLLSELDLALLEAGTYYVAVYGYGATDAGEYELAITGVADPCDAFVDTYEPNNTMGEATVVVDGDSLEAALCPTVDSDFYAVTGLMNSTITVETMPLSVGEYDTDTYMNLYDADGNVIDSDDDGGFGYTSMITYTLPADGTVYFEVVVSSWAAGDVFDYILDVTVDDPPAYIPTYTLYRDDVMIAEDIEPVDLSFRGEYTDAGLDFGTYCYVVTQDMADMSVSDPSEEACASITPMPPMDLMGSAADAVVELSWMPPLVVETGWLGYHDGTFENSLASTEGGAGIATLFQPLLYPVTVDSVRFHVSGTGWELAAEVFILADDGMTVLDGPYNVNAVEDNDWITIDNVDFTLESGGFMLATYNVGPGGPYVSVDMDHYMGNVYFGHHTSGFSELGSLGFEAVASHEAYVNYDGNAALISASVFDDETPVSLGTPVKTQTFAATDSGLRVIHTSRTRYNPSQENAETRDLTAYNVYRGTDPEDMALLGTATETFYTDNTVENGMTYFYLVTAAYDPEGESLPTNMIALTPLGSVGIPYFSDFEADGGGFNPSGEWQWGAPTFVDGPASAYSGTNLWGTVLDNDYPNNSNSWLILPFDLSTANASADLSFAAWFDLETNWDYAYVGVDHDNDGVYDILAQYNGNSGGWIEESLTIPASHLTAYAKIAFIFQSDGSVQYPGIYLDDVSVQNTPVGLLTGVVTSTYNDAVMPDALVLCTETTTLEEHGGLTGADGTYMMYLPVGTYDVGVGHEDYFLSDVTQVVITLDGTVTHDVALTPNVAAPSNLMAQETDGGVQLSWDLQTGVEGFEGFESGGIPLDWTTIDQDGDGNNWMPMEGFAHTGDFSAMSESYRNGLGPLTPNNYLITPQFEINDGTTLSFWVGAVDAAWYFEHFSLLLSIAGTNPADFTVELLDYTLATDVWTEIVVDLSAYAGFSGHIAWVHRDVTDVYSFSIDDISVVDGEGLALLTNNFDTPEDIERFQANPFKITEDMTEEEIQVRWDEYENADAASSLRSELLFFKVYSNVGGAGWNMIGAAADGMSYFDDSAVAGQSIEYKVTAQYDIAESDYSNTVQLQVVGVDELGIPNTFALHQNYPNPFNPTTSIRYDLPEAAYVRIVVYNVLGQKVATLVDQSMNAGYHDITWSGTNDLGSSVSSGIYLYRIESENFNAVRKLMLLK